MHDNKVKLKLTIAIRWTLLYHLTLEYVGQICFLHSRKKKCFLISHINACNSMKLGFQHNVFVALPQTEKSNICNLYFQLPQAVWQDIENYSHQ